MLKNNLSYGVSAAWFHKHGVETGYIPHTAHLVSGGDTSVHIWLRTQAFKSIEQAPGLNTLLSEVNTGVNGGSVQLLCGWRRKGFIKKAEAHISEMQKAVCPPYPILLRSPALSLCPSSTIQTLIKPDSKLIFFSSSFLMSNQIPSVAES